jgi:Flp pilus assembly protein TadG
VKRRNFVASLQHSLKSSRRAQTTVLVTVGLVAMLGISALAVDVGELWTTRHLMQTAADAGALAGVDAITIGQTTLDQITMAADAATAQNGFTNNSGTAVNPSTVTVTVVNPPTTGPYANNTNAVQVTVAQVQPTFFMRVLGWKSVPVSAQGTALTTSGGSCVYALNPEDSGTISLSGNGTITSNCGVYDNSNSSSALIASGTSSMTAPLVGVVGGTTYNGGGSTPPTSGIAAFGDPLAWEPEPTGYSCSSFPGTKINSSTPVTLSPGTYCGGIDITSSYANVTFNPGLYIIDGGGLTISGGAVSGSGVTFYLTGNNGNGASKVNYGGVTINGGATVNLSAPCSSDNGSIEGMLFFQDRSITANSNNASVINGGSNSTFTGALYFPTTSLTYNGTSGANQYTYLVADWLTISGTTTIGNNYSCLANGNIIKDAALVY